MLASDLVYIALILFVGLILGQLFLKIKIPHITGYLIAGLILGPTFLNFVPSSVVDNIHIFIDLVLVFVAFSIGSEFNLKYVKKMGTKPFKLAFIISIITYISVVLISYLAGMDIEGAIILGAIASATSPVDILVIFNHYKAKGELTRTVLEIVAIDDVISILLYGLSVSIVKFLGSTSPNVFLNISNIFYDILVPIFLGVVLGIFMELIIKKFKHSEYDATIILIFLLLITSVAALLNVSALLTAVVTGIIFINYSKERTALKVLKVMDVISPMLFIIFFVLAGLSYDINCLSTAGFFVLIYFLARSFGKIIGSFIGSTSLKESIKIKKYLGYVLLPQSGIAIGLSIEADKLLALDMSLEAIVLSAIIIFELISPIIIKVVMKMSGECKSDK